MLILLVISEIEKTVSAANLNRIRANSTGDSVDSARHTEVAIKTLISHLFIYVDFVL